MEMVQKQKAERKKNDSLLRLSRYATVFMTILVIGFGFSVVLGWHGHILCLVQYQANTAAMVYNTALCFILSGFSVLALNYHFRHIAFILGVLIFIMGILSLAQHVFDVNLGIDEIFFKHYDNTANQHPGRMAPNTAFCFLLVAIAIFLIIWRRFPQYSISLSSGLSFLLLSLAILFISGYFTPLQNAYEWGDVTPMAKNTAIGFLLLSICLIGLSCYKALLYHVDLMKALPLVFTFCILISSVLLSQEINEQQQSNHIQSSLSRIVLVAGCILGIFSGLLLRFAQLALEGARAARKSLSLVRATLESTADGIVVIDKEGRVIDYNQRFLKLWKISPDKMENSNCKILMNIMGEQLIDKEKFSLKANQFAVFSNKTSVDELRLKTGCIFEQYSKPQFLEKEVIGRVWSYRDITLRKRLERELLRQTTHDSLTGLPNRALLLDLLNRSIEAAKRSGDLVGVFFLDIDHFSHINDTFGRSKGDQCLKLAAERFKEHLTPENILGRIGGDEFLVIANGFQNPKEAIPVLNHLMKSLVKPLELYGHRLNLTCSIGVTFFPKDGKDVDMLLSNADIAMTRAKENGRNGFEFYTQDMNVYTIEQIELENQIWDAVEKKQFQVYYQPLFKLAHNKLVGVEALIRWKHPTRGFISPAYFIPVAEEIGLIQKIGEWVLMTACEQTRRWHDAGLNKLKVAVNISGQQFKSKALDQVVADVLTKTRLKPEFLELELTESVLIQGSEFVINTLDALKETGVSISIDDFGMGYSCLNYLKRFPVDKLKVDRSFVVDIAKNHESKALIQAIVAMAKNLGLTVLAEGIETEAQLEVLKKLKCDYGQGYYLGRPLAPDDFFKKHSPLPNPG